MTVNREARTQEGRDGRDLSMELEITTRIHMVTITTRVHMVTITTRVQLKTQSRYVFIHKQY